MFGEISLTRAERFFRFLNRLYVNIRAIMKCLLVTLDNMKVAIILALQFGLRFTLGPDLC